MCVPAGLVVGVGLGAGVECVGDCLVTIADVGDLGWFITNIPVMRLSNLPR